jgi:hypothetical protein
MAEWYRRGDGDQARLSRILQVAYDLKVIITSFLVDGRSVYEENYNHLL